MTDIELCEKRTEQFGSPYPHILGKPTRLKDGKRIHEIRKCSWCGRIVRRVLRS